MNLRDALKSHADKNGTKTLDIPDNSVKVGEGGLKGALGKFKANLDARQAAVAERVTHEIEAPDVGKAFELGDVPIWAFSTLKDFETCPYRVFLAKVRNVEGPEPEPNVGADRGNKIHDHIEGFIRGDVKKLVASVSGKPWRADLYKSKIESARERYDGDRVIVEENWGIRSDWSPCSWKDADLWGRAKLDLFERESDTSCIITDWKTGRKFGNEIKHAEQGLSYGLFAINRYPEMEQVRICFEYLDFGETYRKDYTRAQLQLLMNSFHKRAVIMTSATQFPAKPSHTACMFCRYGKGKFGNGYCPKAV